MADKKYIKQINNCIEKIAKGDMAALDKLFAITKKPLFFVARAYLTDKDKAEDILSETYLKVVKNAKNFDSNQNGYNYLYEIVKNTALNQNKKDSFRRHEDIEENSLPDYDCLDEVLNKILASEAVSCLESEEKQIIYEYFFEGKTLQEIADGLKKPKTTVYDKLKKITSKMKKHLK
ncbi:MAG: sigma-70 family RNA polymerase sigma factor [Clostridia bacterium]|nr:sigma-70 family RNA polymerase sigma factor [Clostridia bacterium]